jgi:hypothetical protein
MIAPPDVNNMTVFPLLFETMGTGTVATRLLSSARRSGIDDCRYRLTWGGELQLDGLSIKQPLASSTLL